MMIQGNMKMILMLELINFKKQEIIGLLKIMDGVFSLLDQRQIQIIFYLLLQINLITMVKI